MDDWKMWLMIIGGSLLFSLLVMTCIHWTARQKARENGDTYEFSKKKFIGFTLLFAAFLSVMIIVMCTIGLLGLIVIIGLPGALISFLKKG